MSPRNLARLAALVAGLALGVASMPSTSVIAAGAPNRALFHGITMNPDGTPIVRD